MVNEYTFLFHPVFSDGYLLNILGAEVGESRGKLWWGDGGRQVAVDSLFFKSRFLVAGLQDKCLAR
jgi:hypothetical protein